jgi:hypothetical protein
MNQLFIMTAIIPGKRRVIVPGMGIHPDRETARQVMLAEVTRGIAELAPKRLGAAVEIVAIPLPDDQVVEQLVRLAHLRPDLIDRAVAIAEGREAAPGSNDVVHA